MEQLMKLIIFLCLIFWTKVSAIPLPEHEPGVEHIIIINKDHPTPPRVADLLSRLELTADHPDVKHVYNNSQFQGFAASMNTHCLGLLANMDDVSIVEQTTSMTKPASILVPASGVFFSRNSAPWGLQRISDPSTSAIRGGVNNLNYTYNFGTEKLGAGADVYIIDTGIDTHHNLFGGRASIYWSYDNSTDDEDGHGTHVAGIAAGNVLGVAEKANIFGIKAINGKGGGTTAAVIKGIDETIQCHEARKGNSDYAGAVMSMSLASGNVVPAINHAITAATKAGVHAVVAAGNDGQDACRISPASAGGDKGPAITVGAIDIDSKPASFSNFGKCVDVYAPGVDIISAWISGPNEVKSLTGTSMATPHVTGLVAYAMANRTLAEDPALMKEYILSTAIRTRGGMLLANNGLQSTLPDKSAEQSAEQSGSAAEEGDDCPDDDMK